MSSDGVDICGVPRSVLFLFIVFVGFAVDDIFIFLHKGGGEIVEMVGRDDNS